MKNILAVTGREIRYYHVFLALSILSLGSCLGSKPVPYFSGGIVDTAKVNAIVIPDQVIQKADILSIKIYSDNPEATAIFNQAGGSAASRTGSGERGMAAVSSSSTDGYLVSNDGKVRLHALGDIQAEGLTRKQLEEDIISRIRNLGVLTNPYCVVRFGNFKVTILGEVKAPGVFTIPTERASILEVLGMAGDITDYGLKDQVLLVRENDGKRTYANINLTDPNIFTSPYFYMRQNDVVVVKPDVKKPTATDQRTLQYISLGLTAVSTIAIIITLFQ